MNEEVGHKVYFIESPEHFDVTEGGRSLTDDSGLAFVELVLVKARGVIMSKGQAPKTNPIPWLSQPTDLDEDCKEKEDEE